ncbi:hypothetical protein [Mycobacterium sp. D16R24]|uniref:hypothetical protein n=1 Tax=Mycobacterium sp. D16R24 TaxID=1855656 RepID=UPI001116BC28|nr:hypothetical protein [Mycobacterium sp. D16R24]
MSEVHEHASGATITAPDIRRAIEDQCTVQDGSVAGYVSIEGVLDLVELANSLNYAIRKPQNLPLDITSLHTKEIPAWRD